jgi:hypothetical protein
MVFSTVSASMLTTDLSICMLYICQYSCQSDNTSSLLGLDNNHDYVWADTVHLGECNEALLNLGASESLIHQKSVLNHQLNVAANEFNRI